MVDFNKIVQDQTETERLLRANCLPETWYEYEFLVKRCLALELKWVSVPENVVSPRLDLPDRDLPVLWLYESGLIYMSDIPHDYGDEEVEIFLRGTPNTGPVIHWIDPTLILPERKNSNGS